MNKTAPLLSIQGLSIAFGRRNDEKNEVVRSVYLDINPGETAALVGETGSGKSLTALSVMGLLPYPLAWHPGGRILFKGEDLLVESEERLRAIRGNRISMIFQEPLSSLNPLHSIGRQISESLRWHQGSSMSESSVQKYIVELLHMVQMEDAVKRLHCLPHEFSGGQRQRIMIAMALVNKPDLLIADEPTTALDVTVQAQILDILKHLQRQFGMALLLISHDLNVVRHMADRVNIMRRGRIVEQGKIERVFRKPEHAYTIHLLQSEMTGRASPVAPGAEVILEAKDIRVWFPVKKTLLGRPKDYVKAVDDVSFSLRRGETMGIVGESGSGKTTLGNTVLRLLRDSKRHDISFLGWDIGGLKEKELRSLRCRMQIIFQDPFSSLSPRLSVRQIIEEGLNVHKSGKTQEENDKIITQALTDVGLSLDMQDRYPHELSGGQRQRVAIARVLVLKPDLIVLDEPTSALDVSTQAQVIGLLQTLQENYNLTYIFITHDLRVVTALAHHVLVMHQGKVVEAGPIERVFGKPENPYTRRLIEASVSGIIRAREKIQKQPRDSN